MARRKSSSTATVKDQETFSLALGEYEKCMRRFHDRDWDGARGALSVFIEDFSGKPEASEIVDRAQVHHAACVQKLSGPIEEPTSPEGWLYRGVALGNEGLVDEAFASLEHAANGGLPSARVDYVRAAALAVAERNDEALAYLARAIEADPENKAFSLGDPDFERLRESAGYVALVEPPQRSVPGRRETAGYEQDATSHSAGLGQIDD